MTFIPLLVFLILASILGGVIGWLVHKLISGDQVVRLENQLLETQQVISRQKTEISATESKNSYINSIVSGKGGIPVADDEFNSEYDKLKKSEQDLRVKLSQLYAKKQTEIEGALKQVSVLEERLGITNSSDEHIEKKSLPPEDNLSGPAESQSQKNVVKTKRRRKDKQPSSIENQIHESEVTLQATPRSLPLNADSSLNKDSGESYVEIDPVAKPAISEAITVDEVREDLTQIKGIGVVIQGLLNDEGIYSIRQVAELKTSKIDYLSEKLGAFGNRILRDQWIEQAKAIIKEKENTLPDSDTLKDQTQGSRKLKVDDLTKLEGVDKAFADLLNQSGIYSYEQLTALNPKEVKELRLRLGSFGERIEGDDLINKAKNIIKDGS